MLSNFRKYTLHKFGIASSRPTYNIKRGDNRPQKHADIF